MSPQFLARMLERVDALTWSGRAAEQQQPRGSQEWCGVCSWYCVVEILIRWLATCIWSLEEDWAEERDLGTHCITLVLNSQVANRHSIKVEMR